MTLRYLFPHQAEVAYNFVVNKLITNPKTLGDKIRNKRLELGLSQSQVAKIFNTDPDLIYMWEKNIIKPSIKRFPEVITFLGYFPFEIDESSLGGKIKLYRYMYGLSQEAMAEFLNLNESTIRDYERGIRKPLERLKVKIQNKLKIITFF